MSTFLSADDVRQLTGRTNHKLQADALKQMGIPFWVNPIGKAVVARTAVEGRTEAPKPKNWVMPD
jgi:hypothetical protein